MFESCLRNNRMDKISNGTYPFFISITYTYIIFFMYFCKKQKKTGMMIHIANPIYDSVFKYLIEDERIARTLLSALLKKGVFDQTMKDRHNRQVLTLDEERYAGDEDMMYILRRLLAAASDSKLRQDMNVEDEYFMAIENRDTAIMNRDKIIAEKDIQIAEMDTQIAEKESQIAEQSAMLRSMIQNMVNSGMKLEDVAKATGLSIEKIREQLG